MSLFIDTIKGKKVLIIAHWDCDGVCSGAMLYHIVKEHANHVSYKTLGEQFYIPKEEFRDEYDYIICVDMQPQPSIVDERILYIDHHPTTHLSNYRHYIHDENAQSCTELLWNTFHTSQIIPANKRAYFALLTLLGFISDGGVIDDVVQSLKEYIPKTVSLFTYISLLNTPKRIHWNGDMALEVLCELDSPVDIFNYNHPNLQKFQSYKNILQEYYKKEYICQSKGKFDVLIIREPYNIQGVLCAKHKSQRPIIVINTYRKRCIGSLRISADENIDAGAFLEQFSTTISEWIGGGHEKAGGFSFASDQLDIFLETLKKV